MLLLLLLAMMMRDDGHSEIYLIGIYCFNGR